VRHLDLGHRAQAHGHVRVGADRLDLEAGRGQRTSSIVRVTPVGGADPVGVSTPAVGGQERRRGPHRRLTPVKSPA